MVAFSNLAGPIQSLNLKEDAKFQKEVAQVQQLTPGVVYVCHLPNLLNETQILSYFSQCGTVTRFRLSRKKRTGNSKGYACVECESEDIAKIVAETMNNYLFGERLSESKQHNQNRLLRKKLAYKGIDYDFPSLILQKMESISKMNHLMSTKGHVLCKKKKKVLGTPDTPEKTVDTQGPTPVCTSTFLERQKSEVAEMNDDDEDNEIVFEKPISCVKEEIQETQTPTHSQKKRQSIQ
uniref:RRM domain-containing protein n=1 Tax=Pan paniscus TaxID=9597 RepID=A0A2R9A149_PANPA